MPLVDPADPPAEPGAGGAFGAVPDPLLIEPLAGPPDVVVEPPGSKSLSNRALLVAGLARGRSRLHGLLASDDTRAMWSALESFGVTFEGQLGDPTVELVGIDGTFGPGRLAIDVNQSGTTCRFIVPASALSSGPVEVDGHDQMRARPMHDLVTALDALGAQIEPTEHLPVRLSGGGVGGGTIAVPGSTSSQFLSGLLLSSPYYEDGLDVTIEDTLVSRPYVDMTLSVMEAFGAVVRREGYRRFHVEPGRYHAVEFSVEPDASSASYFFALAAMTRGRVLVQGLGSSSIQGDMGFLDALEQMGAVVRQGPNWTEVVGRGVTGIDIDMADISDTAPTLAVVAAVAESPTRVRNIGFVRGKESDRITAVVTELRRLGVRATEHDDGFTVHPSDVRPGVVCTYADHRIAMAFALLGLCHEGVEIADPGCVAKTFPGFWAAVDTIRAETAARLAPR